MLGFVVPMVKEAKCLIEGFSNRKTKTIAGRTIVTGRLGENRCGLCVTGTGKIRSAAGTQLLLDHFSCRNIFHFGSAGALSSELKIGDFVLAKDIIEHDFLWKFGNVEKPNPTAVGDGPLNKKIMK